MNGFWLKPLLLWLHDVFLNPSFFCIYELMFFHRESSPFSPSHLFIYISISHVQLTYSLISLFILIFKFSQVCPLELFQMGSYIYITFFSWKFYSIGYFLAEIKKQNWVNTFCPPAIYSLPQIRSPYWSDTLVIINEPKLIHYYHPKTIVHTWVQSWHCTFYGFW